MALLKDRRILITGASKGLGAVCARAFAADGAKLVLTARSREPLQDLAASIGGGALALAADLTDFQALPGVAEKARAFLGEIDAVLHVAGGGLGLREPLLDWKSGFGRLLDLNLGACVELNRLLLPKMMERGAGNLVHVASIASTEAVASVGYNTAKAALAAYVRALGREVADRGVVVTGILPGGFLAPGNAFSRLKADKPDVFEKWVRERLPRKKLAEAEELVPVLKLLCSEESSMMGGCLIPIDAGEGRAYNLS